MLPARNLTSISNLFKQSFNHADLDFTITFRHSHYYSFVNSFPWNSFILLQRRKTLLSLTRAICSLFFRPIAGYNVMKKNCFSLFNSHCISFRFHYCFQVIIKIAFGWQWKRKNDERAKNYDSKEINYVSSILRSLPIKKFFIIWGLKIAAKWEMCKWKKNEKLSSELKMSKVALRNWVVHLCKSFGNDCSNRQIESLY